MVELTHYFTCMLCCGCSIRELLSPVEGLLEGLVQSLGWGLRTKNGG